MSGKLHVVFCVDTEGPLYESLESNFQRLESFFGISLAPTKENLALLRSGVVPGLTDQEKLADVFRYFDPRYSNLGSWDELLEKRDVITSAAFRNRWQDSHGQGIAYSWFCVDHVGYCENPRRRAVGYHAVFDSYRALVQQPESNKDIVQFHYHPLPYNRKAHSCATYYLNENHLVEILARKIIDRAWFPSVYRPGFHTTRPDSHWFLEQWIPFDYANQACAQSERTDLHENQYGDWRRAPKIWGGYHPHHDDYQRLGGCRRWIFRALNAYSRVRNITKAEVEAAVQEAQTTGCAVLAVTNHDYKDMLPSLVDFYDLVTEVAAHSNVELLFSDALTAARDYVGVQSHSPGLEARVESLGGGIGHILQVNCKTPLFGPQPFLAIKTVSGYHYDNFDFSATDPQKSWTYTLSWQTFPLEEIECIGIAAPSATGTVDIVRIFPRENRQDHICLS